jgi:hypothetical protein
MSGAIASTFGAAVAIGLGGVASLLTGLGAIRFLRGRPMRQPKPVARRVGSPAIGDGIAGDGVRPI